MFQMCSRIVLLSLLGCSAFALGVTAIPDEADARRFRANFSSGGAASSSARSGRSFVRSSDEIAAEARAESRIDWSHAAQHGLDVVKSAIEGALKDSPSQQKTAFSGDTLSRLELEGCVRESSWLDDRQVQYDAKRLQVDTQRADIDRLAAEIDAARLYVDRYSQRSVDGFNAKINNHATRVSHFNSVTLHEIEGDRLAFNARVDRYNAYCNNKRYYGDDLAAVEAKVGRVKTN